MNKTETIGLGVAGLGRGFILTLPALTATSGIKLVAAFDVRAEARDSFSRVLSGRPHDSLESLLADDEVAAVYIATPHELHAPQVIAAARAGKHVLVEKPMATNVADARAMIEAARAAGVVLVVGPSHGFDAPVQRAAGLIASGKFGAVRMVTALNFTDFIYRPRRPQELDPAQGGGVVYSQAAHQFDVVRRIVGQPVTEIMATAGNWDVSRPGDGAYTALVKFTSAAASLTYSGYAHYDSDELLDWVSELGRKKDPALYGHARRKLAGLSASDEAREKLARTFGGAATSEAEPRAPHNEHFGFVLASCEHADLKIMSDGIWIYGDERKEFVPVAPTAVPRANALAEFVGAIRGERRAIHDGEWGLETMLCCSALVQSGATGRPVKTAEMIRPICNT